MLLLDTGPQISKLCPALAVDGPGEDGLLPDEHFAGRSLKL